jgi:hypothetical protein
MNLRFSIALAAFSIVCATSVQASAQEQDATKPSKTPKLHVEAQSGPIVGRVADVAFFGADVGAGLVVAASDSVSFDAEFFYAGATTDAGLGVHWGGARTTLMWTPSRFRIGAGVDLLYFGMERVTENSALTHPGFGAHGHLGFDVIELDGGHALEIFAQPEANWLFGAPLLNASLELAARF